jgi:hypothetical protein
MDVVMCLATLAGPCELELLENGKVGAWEKRGGKRFSSVAQEEAHEMAFR